MTRGAGARTGPARAAARSRSSLPEGPYVPRTGRTRPVRPLLPVVSAVAVLLGWGIVAHNSGAGWVQALGDVLAGVLGVGLLGPGFALGRARVTVVDAPADGAAGLPVEVLTTARARVRVRPLLPPGPEAFVGPHGHRRHTAGTDNGRGLVTLLPARRGVHDAVVAEIATASPFGLMWWRRTVTVALPRPLHVRPRLGRPHEQPPAPEGTASAGARRAPAPVGEPRGVRPYRPGDQRRWVHWPGTAHAGELMVREMEGPTSGPVAIEVRLPRDAEAAERAAERALGTVVAFVDAGTPVRLRTTEAAGPAEGTVSDRRSAGRRLARAVAEGEP